MKSLKSRLKEEALCNATISRALYQKRMEVENEITELDLYKMSLENWEKRLQKREVTVENKMRALASREATMKIKYAQFNITNNYGNESKNTQIEG